MTRIRSNALGLALGSLLAICHAAWAGVVFFGWAQPLLDFVFRIHMMSQPFTVTGFNLGSAVTLVVFNGLTGYVAGWFIGFMMNASRPRLVLGSGDTEQLKAA